MFNIVFGCSLIQIEPEIDRAVRKRMDSTIGLLSLEALKFHKYWVI